MKAQNVIETLTKKKNDLLASLERTPEKQIQEIDAQINDAKSQLEQDAERERLAALEVAMPKERVSLLAVVEATQALDRALENHRQTVHEIR